MSSVAPPRPASHFASIAQQSHAAALGMWIFLATELMFFGPLFFGYTYGRLHYPEGYADASRHTDVLLGTINTAVLLTSSAFMAAAVAARRLGATLTARWLLCLTAALGIVFLGIKGTEYVHEWGEHLAPALDFAFPGPHATAVEHFFYLYFAMTLLHALHLTIGIVLTIIFAIALQRDATGFASAERLEVMGLYWHFVDGVWIFLYPILYLVGRSA
jgi:cytochrome c oxidase subunit 3